MSTMAGAADSTQKKYSSHCYGRKNNSDELDVFEAAGYYSGQNDGPLHPWWTWRMSLDEHVKRPSMFLPQRLGKQASSSSSRHRFEQRQPRSPGGRLASFLNSLFSQSNSKKKMSNKSSSGGSSSMLQSSGKDYEDPDQRRRRRSSISHFRSSSSTKEFYSKSSTNGVSNFYHSNYNNKNSKVTTPTKSHKDFRSSSAHREADASNKPMASTGNRTKKSLGSVGGKSSLLQSKSLDEEEIRGSSSKFHGKFNNEDNNNDKDGGSKESTLVDQEGEESDSSSDLFELQIGAGGYYSSDLPVYETTHMERIRSENPPISLNVLS